MVIKLIRNGQEKELKPQPKEQPIAAANIRILGKAVATPAAPAEKPAAQPIPVVPPPEKTTPSAEEASQAEQLIIRQGELYNQKAILCNQLAQKAEQISQDERLALVEAIMDLKTQYNHNAEKLRYYELHGHFQKVVKEPARNLQGVEKHDLMRMRANCAANISKARKMIEKHQHKPAKVVQYSNKLARLQVELAEIEEALSR